MWIGCATDPNGNVRLPLGEGGDGGEQDALLLEQVRFEIGPQVGDEPPDLGELRVSLTVHRFDLGGERVEQRQLLPEVAVMAGDDVLGERRRVERGPGRVVRDVEGVELGGHDGWRRCRRWRTRRRGFGHRGSSSRARGARGRGRRRSWR